MTVHVLPDTSDTHPTAVLEMAKQNGYADVLVVGIDGDGDLAVMASTCEVARLIYWLGAATRHVYELTED